MIADRIRTDLIVRGVFAGEPEEREEVIGHLAPTITRDQWETAVRFADEAGGDRRGVAGLLWKALRSPEGWADLLACAERAAAPVREERGPAMPSHANASAPPTGPCIHGIDGARPCGECEGAARRRMREAYAAPRFAPTARVAPRSPGKPGSILGPHRPLTDEDVESVLRGGGA